MPEANILYTVTAVVVAALVVWVLAALKMSKEPWARPEAAAAIAAASKRSDADVPVENTEAKAEAKDEAVEEAKAEAPAEDEAEEAAEKKAASDPEA